MRFADASGRLDAEFNPFTDDYLGEILAAFALAWAQMKRPQLNELEDQITRKLAACLKHNPIFRALPFDVTQQFILDDVDAKYLGRLDLHVKYRQSQRDYFAFEAKRLHLTYGTEYSAYVSGEGMGAFIDGPYSEKLPVAGAFGDCWESRKRRMRRKSCSTLSELGIRGVISQGSASAAQLLG